MLSSGDDMAGLAVGKKSDQAQRAGGDSHIGQAGNRKLELTPVGIAGFILFEDAGDGYMVKGSAGILAARNFRASDVLREDYDERGAGICRGAHGEAKDVSGKARSLDGNGEFGFGGGRGDGLIECVCVAADKLLRAIDNHLRRVDLVERKEACIAALTLVHQVVREGIAPTKVVPVGDVFAEDNCLGAGDELR